MHGKTYTVPGRSYRTYQVDVLLIASDRPNVLFGKM